MCLSPHEMSAKRLQGEIDYLKVYVQAHPGTDITTRYERRLEWLEALLKDKAERGEMV